MDLNIEKLKNKLFLGAIGSLIISIYLILMVLMEFVFTGLLDITAVYVLMLILLVAGIILMTFGIYEYCKENWKFVAWIVLIISIVIAVILITYHSLLLHNKASNYIDFITSYILGELAPAIKPLLKIMGFTYAESNYSVHPMFLISAMLIMILFAALGVNSLLKRADRSNEKLAMISGILTLIGAILFLIFAILNYVAISAKLDFAMLKANISITNLSSIKTPILGLELTLGDVLTGINLLFIDPKISDIKELYVLIGLLPLGIINIINFWGFLKESE